MHNWINWTGRDARYRARRTDSGEIRVEIHNGNSFDPMSDEGARRALFARMERLTGQPDLLFQMIELKTRVGNLETYIRSRDAFGLEASKRAAS